MNVPPPPPSAASARVSTAPDANYTYTLNANAPVMRLYSTGPQVRGLQERLNKAGFSAGAVDGDFGRVTRRAVMDFQRVNGLEVDGIAGPATINRLLNTNTRMPSGDRFEMNSSRPNRTATGAPPVVSAINVSTDSSTTNSTNIRINNSERATGGATTLESARASISFARNIISKKSVLRAGDSGSKIDELQGLLGFSANQINGIFDAQTKNRVIDFQRENRLSADGVVGPSTMKALLRNSTETSIKNGSVLTRGAVGVDVLGAQIALGAGTGGQTGKFGPTTERLVKDFQSRNGIQVNGKIGATTWQAIEKANSNVGRYIGKFDAWRNGVRIGRIDVVEIDGKKVAAKTARKWVELKEAAAKDGVYLQLNSGFRTHDEQIRLYRMYQNGTGNLAAYPGYSAHQDGTAIDVDVVSDAAYNWMHRNAPAMGWRKTVSIEPWHWEYFGN